MGSPIVIEVVTIIVPVVRSVGVMRTLKEAGQSNIRHS